MKNWLLLMLFLVMASTGRAQDAAWMLEQAPVVSMVLSKVYEKLPSFSAQGEVKVFSKADPVPSAGVGTLESKGGDLRWEVKLADISSTQFSDTARMLLEHVNGRRLSLLTRRQPAANLVVFPGARACIEQPLPEVHLSGARPLGTEDFEGRTCLRERLTVRDETGRTYELLLWRAKDLDGLPVQLQFAESGEVMRIRLKEIEFRPLPAGRFQLPAGLSKHETIEDLMQWVLAEKIRRRIGL